MDFFFFLTILIKIGSFLFQEFECGVHFEGLEKNKQEWSFTLYDFDGHGKITREVNSNKVESVTL